MLQLGWKAGTEQYAPVELLEYAVLAEQAGFDSISASDHFHPWSEIGQACFVWTWLGAAAAKTKQNCLGHRGDLPHLALSSGYRRSSSGDIGLPRTGRSFLGGRCPCFETIAARPGFY